MVAEVEESLFIKPVAFDPDVVKSRVRRYLFRALVLKRRCDYVIKEGVLFFDDKFISDVDLSFEHFRSFLDTDKFVDSMGGGLYLVDEKFIGRPFEIVIRHPNKKEVIRVVSSVD